MRICRSVVLESIYCFVFVSVRICSLMQLSVVLEGVLGD